MKIFSGNSSLELTQKIADYLCMQIGDATVSKFSDGEINVQINESVRGSKIFIVQSICSPVNDNLIELMVMVDAMRRSSAADITAVIPYFGYARQDRRTYSSRVPITAKVVANCLSHVGVNRILTVDLHSDQIQGFFDIPIDNIFAGVVILKNILQRKLNSFVIVSPDIGGAARARKIAKLLNSNDIVIINKYRPYANVAQIMNVIGDVSNRDCILIDDIIDTGNTFCKAAEVIKNLGAKKIFAYATHPVFSGNIYENIKNSLIDEWIVCDTIPIDLNNLQLLNINVLTLSKLLAEVIRRINENESILNLVC